ncbi:MAG: multidrug ABC transporter ATP-binding protein, partial [Planctomycetota bacterium]
LLHDPQVLLLDEPASGLDPRARIEIRALLKELRSMGKTIMVSSHILPELADVCNKIGIIERGELIVSADVADVMRQVRQRVVLQVAVVERDGKTLDGAAELLTDLAFVEEVKRPEAAGEPLSVTLKAEAEDPSEVARALFEGGYALTLLREEEINLETAFMTLTQGITS